MKGGSRKLSGEGCEGSLSLGNAERQARANKPPRSEGQGRERGAKSEILKGRSRKTVRRSLI